MKKSNKNLCEIKGCYEEYDTRYLGHVVCLKHITLHYEGKINLKAIFNIPIEEVPPERLKEGLKSFL